MTPSATLTTVTRREHRRHGTTTQSIVKSKVVFNRVPITDTGGIA